MMEKECHYPPDPRPVGELIKQEQKDCEKSSFKLPETSHWFLPWSSLVLQPPSLVSAQTNVNTTQIALKNS